MTPTDRPTWSWRAWRVAAGVLVVLVGALLTVGAQGPLRLILPVMIAVTGISVAAWAVVRTRAQRREYEDRLTAWAADHASQAERLRVARELHDIVSHGLGLVTVRAAAARQAAGPGAGEERGRALADIEQASREATTELRRMLTVLRRAETTPAPLRPAAALADLPAIVEAAEMAGLSTTLEVHPVGQVSPGVQVTLCALVREALANTARHAGPTDVRVDVHRDGEAIVTTVHDAGPRGRWQAEPGAGLGLRGLRERVTALGGTLVAGPVEHGFHLTARLPDMERA